ncbi:MAG: DMT family transporter [Selenomonadaceae bacterium]|nr:DMT family transporter [Selenomonadaceae bacterium]
MQLRGTLMLLGAAFFWGTTFVAQMSGMDGLGPFSYAATRYFLGFLSLTAVLIFTRKSRQKERLQKKYSRGFLVGVGTGIFLFLASSMQQISMLYTTAGKAAFITCLYIILVPLGAILLGKKILRENFIGAALALIGLYFLAINEEFSINRGDIILFFSAFFWAAQILLVDKFASKVDVLELSTSQIFVTLILSFFAMIIFETPTPENIFNAAIPIFYGGVMSAGVAFTLQIYGQKYAEPSAAAILMSFEAIFGALSAWIILGEEMTAREIFGCVLMFSGVIAAQWSVISKRS